MNRLVGTGIVGAIVVVAVWSVYWANRPPAPEPSGQPTSAVPDPVTIRAIGRLEPSGGILSVAAQPGDRVVRLTVRENDLVQPGTVLAEMESEKSRQLEIASLKRQIDVAEAQHEAQLETVRQQLDLASLSVEYVQSESPELAAQEQQLQVLRDQLQEERQLLESLQQLRSSAAESVTRVEIARQQLQVRKTEADITAAEAAIEAAARQHQFAIDKARREKQLAETQLQAVEQSQPALALQQALEAAELRQQQTQPQAVTGGTVLKILTPPGDVVSRLPILQMADLTEMVCVAEVHVSQLPALRRAIETSSTERIDARITSDALSEPLRGSLAPDGIQPLIGAAEQPDLDPFAETDRYVATLRIAIVPEDLERAREFVHLPVDVDLQVAAESPP